MKKFLKISLIIFAVFGLILASVVYYIYQTKPVYKGSVVFKDAKGVSVYYDKIGVPHIYAKNEEKAMMALGYVHAQDRLWQMELLRRIAAGRLAEIFGADLVETDVFFRSLGIESTVVKQIAQLQQNPKVLKLSNAYLKGVNQYINEGKTPLEFTLLGIKKENYTLKDIHYVSAYMAFSFAHAFKTDPLISAIQSKLGSNYVEDLGIDHGVDEEVEKSSLLAVNFASASRKILQKMPFPQFIGSNGWAIAAHKSKTGKVLFENDPHIGYAQPSVWYQAHLKTPKYENYGFYIGLMPFPLLAHNRNYAFGITMFENDDIDFYQLKEEDLNSITYKTAQGNFTYQIKKETIQIKGEEPKIIEVKYSHLGPIFNYAMKSLKGKPSVAIQWVYQTVPPKILEVSYGINHASSIKQFQKSLYGLSAPGLNMVYGDKKGNIGLWSVAKLYEKKVGTQQIIDANKSEALETKWLPFHQNPQQINPHRGYVLTANANPGLVNGKNYPGYYLPKNRYQSIENQLTKEMRLGKNTMMAMPNQHNNSTDVRLMKAKLSHLQIDRLTNKELMVLDELVKWKGGYSTQDVGATIYQKWLHLIVEATFKDELGEEDFENFVATNLYKNTLNTIFYNPSSVWWDNITTKQKETINGVLTNSFKIAVLQLEKQLGSQMNRWQWGKVHQVTFEHPLAKMEILKKWLNVGPFEIAGSNESVLNTMFDFTTKGVYKVNAGPSTKRVVDFANIENSYAILPTGQSGHFLSPYYKNQTSNYLKGKYYKMLLNDQEIKKNKNVLIFQ